MFGYAQVRDVDETRRNRPSRRWRRPWRWVPFGLRLFWARVRSLSARHRALRRCVVGAVVVVAFGVWVNAVTAAREAHEQWGTLTDVFVLNEEANIGEELTGREVRSVRWPVAFVPGDAITNEADLVGVFAVAPSAGDIVRASHLLAEGSGPEVPEGMRALSIPVSPTLPVVARGATIEIIVVADPIDGAGDPLESSGVVLDSGPEVTVVAVPASDVAAIAEGLLRNRVVVAAA